MPEGATRLVEADRDADLRALSRQFAAVAAVHDRDASFPHDNIAALHRAGLLGLTVPRRYGGGGAGLAEAAEAIGIIAEGCASTALVFAMQLFKQAGFARHGIWTEALRARVGTDAVQHGALVNTLRVEPELGSPTRGGLPATVARRLPDGSAILNGHKIYSTGAPGLRWMDVWARSADEPALVGHVLVPADAPGVRIVETWDHHGMRATGSHDVVFTDVHLPQGHVEGLRPPAQWSPDPEQQAWNAAGLGALYTGVARAARDWVVTFLQTRTPTALGAPLATLPRMQEKIGEIEMLLTANDRLIGSIAEQTDRDGPPSPSESGLVKTMIMENAVRAVDAAASLAGNHAHARANAIERYLRDVRSGPVQVPQPDAAWLGAGRAVLQRPTGA
jgi:alkylation response protein AidB-like acyl-CoA dehydrogenase